MNKTSASIVTFLSKKKTIITMIIVICCFVVSSFISLVFRKSIRAQEMDAVVQNVYKNKQFQSINEEELQTLLDSQESTIIGLIDIDDSKTYQSLDKMFNQKDEISELPDTIYIYAPIYNQPKIYKQLNIKDKNTFLVINEKKELGRFGFNELKNGTSEISEKINLIINPKIQRKNPVRINVTEKKESETETN